MKAKIMFVLVGLISGLAWAQDGVQVTPLLKSSVTTAGQKAHYLNTDKPEVTSLIVELAPGAETGWHRHPVPTYAYVLEGDLVVDIEDDGVHEFHAGQAFLEVVNTRHNGKNPGKVPVKILVFFGGEEGSPNTLHADKDNTAEH